MRRRPRLKRCRMASAAGFTGCDRMDPSRAGKFDRSDPQETRMKRRQFAALAAAAACRPHRPGAGPHHCGSWWAFRPAARPTSSRACWPRRCAHRSGQNVIVENKPGAAGRRGAGRAQARRAGRPDAGAVAQRRHGDPPWLYSNLGYDPVKDFTPVSRIVTFDFAVTAGPGAPAGDLKAVLAWMKANPGQGQLRAPPAPARCRISPACCSARPPACR